VEPPGSLDWVLDEMVGRVAAISHAVVLSRDGLVMGASRGLRRDDAEHLAALAAGVQSLARGAGQQVNGGEVRQIVVEMETALLFITAAGQGSCLAVLSSGTTEAGLIAYEMAVLVKRIGQHLGATLRPAGAESAAKGPGG
jgi:predicted regulator of Ras-like GTPase activity (Roadblock/LC7/MglB family)